MSTLETDVAVFCSIAFLLFLMLFLVVLVVVLFKYTQNDMYSPLVNGDETEVNDKVQERLKTGIQEYLEMTSTYCGHSFSNRFQARSKLVYLLVVAFYNCTFTFYNLCRRRESGLHIGVASLELFAVLAFLLKAIVYTIGVLLLEESAFHARELVDDLDSAGSFSLLWFLPAPAKVIYWWNNKSFLFEEYIKDPPTTCLHWVRGSGDEVYDGGHGVAAPQFRPYNCEHWVSIKKHCCKDNTGLFCAIVPFIFFGWILIRILVPMAIVAGVLLATPAAIIKMSSITKTQFVWHIFPKGWTRLDYFQALGVLNQMSKIWSPQSIENVGFEGHITAAKEPLHSTGEAFVTGRIFRRNLIHCAFKTLPLMDAICFFAVLDIRTVGKTLNKGFKSETPYKVLHKVEVHHNTRIVKRLATDLTPERSGS